MSNYLDWDTEGYVSVWVGDFASRDEFESFFEERIGDEAYAESPINDFAAAAGFGFYDHDRQEAEFFGKERLAVEKLLAPFSYSTSYLEEAAAAARAQGLETGNTAVLLFDLQYGGETRAQSPLRFVGSFPFDETALPAEEFSV